MSRAIQCDKNQAFTLVELLASTAVFVLLLVLVLNITKITSRMWRDTTGKMQAFEAARSSFDKITATLGQTVLNTYWEYDNVANPTRYERCSELQFFSGPMASLAFPASTYPTHTLFFQAITGTVADKAAYGNMPSLLNAFGYFVEYGDDANERPSFLPPSVGARYRYRLKEWRVPAEKMSLYSKTSGVAGQSDTGAASLDWIDLTAPAASTLAENVVALVICPKDSGSTSLTTSDFVYHSRNSGTSTIEANQRHQLPPEVEVVMIAATENSVIRTLGNQAIAPELIPLTLFKSPNKLEADLKALTDILDSKRIEYLMLRSTVKLRNSRWSQN